MNCFVENSVDCTRSKVEVKDGVDFFVMIINVTTKMNIKEERDGRCKLFIQLKSTRIHFGEWVVEQIINEENYTRNEIRMAERQINKELKKIDGLKGVCKFEKQELTEMLSDWNMEDSTLSEEFDFENFECRGRLFEEFV